MNALLTKYALALGALKGAAASVLVFGASLLGYVPQQGFGQATTIPSVVALYEDSLQDKITSTATTATLVRGTDKQTVALSGTYGFIIDEGTSSEEFVICTAASTALSGCTRGLSVTNPNTSVTALKFAHRRGASVKITNYPQIGVFTRLLNGTDGFPSVLHYQTEPLFTYASHQFVTWDKAKDYADSLANTGAADATTTVQGLVEMTTFDELASGTYYGGTGAALVATTRDIATSKWAFRLYKGANADSDTYVGTFSPALASISTGMEFTFVASDSNVGTATFNPNGTGAKTIIRANGDTLHDGDIPKNTMAQLVYDGSNMRLVPQDSSPVGAISAYASASAPNGWLLANGQAVSRATYSRLFALIKTQYGVGDNSTTFNVPDLGGRLPIGIGTGPASTSYDALGETGGHTTHTQTVAELAPHTHTISNAGSPGSNVAQSGAYGTNNDFQSGSTGSGTAMNIQNPYITVQYIIKY